MVVDYLHHCKCLKLISVRAGLRCWMRWLTGMRSATTGHVSSTTPPTTQVSQSQVSHQLSVTICFTSICASSAVRHENISLMINAFVRVHQNCSAAFTVLYTSPLCVLTHCPGFLSDPVLLLYTTKTAVYSVFTSMSYVLCLEARPKSTAPSSDSDCYFKIDFGGRHIPVVFNSSK